MSVSPFLIYKSSVLYLVIPILFFFLGWLRLGIGLMLSILLLIATSLFLKNINSTKTSNSLIILTKEHYVAFILLLLFLFSTGNTGFLGCWGVDIPWRNAVYQDLIRQPWPVTYEYSHSILCYYMTFWLVPAEITYLLNLDEIGSNVVLFIWMYIGLLLIFFLLCDVLKPKKEYIILITILFLFFSGINTLGMIIKGFFGGADPLVPNYPGRIGWAFSDCIINGLHVVYILRSIYLCIADVYNQFFAIAITTLLFLKFRDEIDLYIFIGLLALPYSPIGFIGIFVVEALEFLKSFFAKNKLKNSLKENVIVLNGMAIFAIVPALYFYFSMNINSSTVFAVNADSSYNFLYIPLHKYNHTLIFILLLYYFIYFGIYALLIFKKYKKESLFFESIFCLIVFPFFRIGSGEDFNFNAAICPYIILFILIIQYLLTSWNAEPQKFRDIILVFCLSIAMLTPVIQITTSFRYAYLHGSISCKWNPWNPKLLPDSFSDKEVDEFGNFLANNYHDKIFFKYFIKK